MLDVRRHAIRRSVEPIVHHFTLFADYFQFYLQDEEAAGDLSDSWTPQATSDLLAVNVGVVGVGTVRNMDVSVALEVRDESPNDDLASWDHVAQCGINLPSGRMVVAGCTDYFPDALRIPVEPGYYRVRIFYGNLDSLSEDGLDGEDHYRVVLWPGEPTEPIVVKRYVSPSEAPN